MQLSIISKDERRKAVIAPGENGAVITYYRSTEGTFGSGWRFDRECCTNQPVHVACDFATKILNGPPKIGGRM